MSSPENSRVKKVCFIAPKAYPLFNPDVKQVFGGAEVDLYFLATELAKDDNFAVSFITADYGQNDFETIESVRIIKSLNFNKNLLTGTTRIWQAMQAADAHIYFQEAVSWGTFLVALFCNSHKRTFVYRTANQGESDGTFLKGQRLLKKAFSWSLHKAGAVIVQNDIDKENLQNSIDIDSIVIPNGQPLLESDNRQRDTVLWVGRSTHLKRPELFIKLARYFPEESFTMICQEATGDQNYKALLAEAGKVDNLQFIKAVPFASVNNYFRQSKVFVNTSDSEGFPNTFIQACKCATPILSLNVNPDDFINRHNCGISCDGDWKQMIDSLRNILKEDRYLEMGENAKKYVRKRHNLKMIIKQYKQLFRELVKHNHPTSDD
ncbi:MAG: glycosyltransferase [Phycisphaerae bacterium]|nr:glycosyltransferase family 4 protein [Phycisphaerae bacterium]NIP56047.1 glycosyltransferase family 4 protein [Phycisphaerae bacterium]NIS50317.1 glycosyltransferase family 4 protein [Phycisphaerae bacterium]NIU08064.1 glycosyltransferase family 4 protein [Phycisphaerae bacterium]NIU59963.1 glycosyltransferase [Phycisphaerae bacterium]